MSRPKRHHIIPMMMQRRFVDADGMLWFFDRHRPQNGVRRSTPKNLFVEGEIYSTVSRDGSERDPALEKYFATVEGLAEPVMKKIVDAVAAGRLPGLLGGERSMLDIFIMYQYRRVPDFFRKLDFDAHEVAVNSVRDFEARFGPVTEGDRAKLLDDDYLRNATWNARIAGSPRLSPAILKRFEGRGLTVAVVTVPEKRFVLGSFPFARFGGTYGRADLDHPGTELWLPLSSTVAVSPLGAKGTESFMPLKEARLVRHVNLDIAKRSSMIASSARDLIVSLSHPR